MGDPGVVGRVEGQGLGIAILSHLLGEVFLYLLRGIALTWVLGLSSLSGASCQSCVVSNAGCRM